MRPGISYDLIKYLLCRMCGSFIVCTLLGHLKRLKQLKRSLSEIYLWVGSDGIFLMMANIFFSERITIIFIEDKFVMGNPLLATLCGSVFMFYSPENLLNQLKLI